MTLWVYSSVTYIVCVLDSEGQWMGLKSLLIVEHFFLPCLQERILCQMRHDFFFYNTNPAHSWRLKCKNVDCSRDSASNQRQGAPPPRQ